MCGKGRRPSFCGFELDFCLSRMSLVLFACLFSHGLTQKEAVNSLHSPSCRFQECASSRSRSSRDASRSHQRAARSAQNGTSESQAMIGSTAADGVEGAGVIAATRTRTSRLRTGAVVAIRWSRAAAAEANTEARSASAAGHSRVTTLGPSLLSSSYSSSSSSSSSL